MNFKFQSQTMNLHNQHPKLLMYGKKLESVAPTQEQVAHQQDIPYKVKYQCKFCEMLWPDKLALFYIFYQIFAILLLCLNLKFSLIIKTLPKMEFKTSDNSYKPIKSHRLGNAARSVHVCRKKNMDVKFVKKMSLAYAGYISKIFTPFPHF